MRKTVAAGAIAAALTAGALLGAPAFASAGETASDAVGWVEEALSDLVDDGTITEDQADAVESALDEARPARGFGRHGHGGHVELPAVAEALGVSEEELLEALRDGSTVAEVAEEQGVEVDTVVDAIVEARRARLDEAVEAGELTQEQADELLAGVEERADDLVAGEVPAFGPGHHGRGHGMRHGTGPGGPWGGEAPEEDDDAASDDTEA